MALFGRKKLTLDEILKGIDELPEEEKAKVKAKMEDVDKAEDEREIDKVEEEKAETPEMADEKAEEVKDETAEIGEDVDKVENEVATDEETPVEEPLDTNTDDEPVEGEAVEDTATEETAEENPVEAVENDNLDSVEKENAEDVNAGLAERISALEEFTSKIDIDKLSGLIAKLEEINAKHQADIGYKGSIPDGKKSYDEMNADELKRELAFER